MYTEYFGLTRKPFENTPDSRFLFMSRQHREVLASMIYGIDSAKGFILVAGDIGTGKTTLINALLRKMDAGYIAVNIINPRTNFHDILSYIADRIDVSSDGKSDLELIEAMQERLSLLAEEKKRVILIIDEAHLLSDTVLEDIRLLSNIENESQKLIQIVLVGQNEIYRKLDQPILAPLKQRLVIRRRLFPLKRNESSDYIKHRLLVAGQSELIFKKGALRKIFKKSRGTPRLINQICDNALLIGYALGADTIGVSIIKEVLSDMGSDRTRQGNAAAGIKRWIYPAGILSVIGIVLVCLAAYNVPQRTKMTMGGGEEPSPVSFSVPDKLKKQKAALPTPETGMHAPRAVAPEQLATGAATVDAEARKPPPPSDTDSDRQNPLPANDKAAEVQIVKGDTRLHPVKVSLPAIDVGELRERPLNKEKKVLPRDWLRKIAFREYGSKSDTIIDMIHMANPDLKNVDRIYPGQKLVLPRIDKKDLIARDDHGNFYIHFSSDYHMASANKRLQRLIREKRNAFMVPCRQNQNSVYRIYLGAFMNYEEAEKRINTLKLKHFILDKEDLDDLYVNGN